MRRQPGRSQDDSTVPVVGRSAELDALTAAFSRLLEGAGAAAFLEGEPGIGKSRLMAEVLHWAGANGFRVYAGSCEQLEQTRPFGPWVEALGCRPSSPDPQLAAIGRMLYPDEKAAPDDQPAGGVEYRVVEALVDLLERLSAAGPVVVAIEDLHWADPSTLVAFRAVQRRLSGLPVGLLATLRPAPHSQALEALLQAAQDEGALNLHLAPLADDEVAELAGHILGAGVGRRLQKLLKGAAGNPLFVGELLKGLVEEGAVRTADSEADVDEPVLPPTLGLTILRRLSSLPGETVELLRLSSVLGSTFSLGDLAGLSGRPVLELAGAVRSALAAGLLVESGADLSFRHDLLREVIYQDLPQPVRAGLHVQAGRMLGAAGASPQRVAVQMALGAAPGDAEAIEWLARAATDLQATAPSAAVGFWRRALELMNPSDPRRDGFQLELATQLIWSGRISEAERMARSLLSRPHDPRIEGRLRLSLGRILIILGRFSDAKDICEQTGESSSLEEWERVQLLSDASHARFLLGDLPGAEALARKALGGGGSEHAMVALCTLSQVAMFRGETPTAIRLANEVVRGVMASRTVVRRLPSHYFLSLCLLAADRFDEMQQAIRLGREDAEELGNLAALPFLEWASALHRYFIGEWDDAAPLAESGLAFASEIGFGQGRAYAQSLRALIAANRGELSRAGELVQTALEEPEISWFRNWPLVAEAVIYESSADNERALESLRKAWQECLRTELVSEMPSVGPRLVSLLIQSGDRAAAVEIAARLEQAALVVDTKAAEGAALLARGLLENDAELLEKAAAAYAGSPRVFERARAFEDAGFALARGGNTGGAPLLKQARDLYEALGAEPHAGRAAARLRTLGVRSGARGRRGRPSAGWEALTSTEIQVVKLVAQGLTNREIAGRLFLSHRTVETHITHVFQKLGFSSRSELVAQAIHRGI